MNSFPALVSRNGSGGLIRRCAVAYESTERIPAVMDLLCVCVCV